MPDLIRHLKCGPRLGAGVTKVPYLMWTPVISHASQIERLRRALREGTLAQAYLFTGPRGVGKALVARTLATDVILSGAKDLDSSAAPQNDNIAERVARDQHPDVIWLRVLPDKSEIGMEQWRAVEAKVQFRALEGERKLIIIDDAELMSPSVANACLKTLEEPPTHTHFILVAHDADRLLPTIRSRCQQMLFSPLPQGVVQSWLVGQGIAAPVAMRAAQLAQGSLQRGKILADPQVVAQLDTMVKDVAAGISPSQVLVHASSLAVSDALPELLDGLAITLRDRLLQRAQPRLIRQIRAIEDAGQFLSVKGANKELILNELFITLA